MPKIPKKTEAPKEKKSSNSLLRMILALNPTRMGLDFGINENCRLTKIDNTPRIREGEVQKRNTYVTWSKYNGKNEVVGQTEFNYFNLDASQDFVLDSFTNQFAQLAHIISLYNPDAMDEFNPLGDITTEEALKKALKKQESCTKIQNAMAQQFEEIMKDHIGETSPLMAVKVITDKTGKYLNLPKEARFCAPMGGDYSFLKLTAYELRLKENSLKAPEATPDNKTDSSPSTKGGGNKKIMNL
jgi:hypothetical protein